MKEEWIRAKILAAHRGQVNKVLIPLENKKDIEEIPKRVLKKVELVLVDHMDEVLRQALILKEGEELFASDEENQPFCVEAPPEAAKQPPAADELTAH